MRLLYPNVFINSLNLSEKMKLLETLKTIFSILVLMIARIFPKDSIDVCETSIIESSDKILNAGWIDFILRPGLKQKSFDRLEEVVVGNDRLHNIVGWEV